MGKDAIIRANQGIVHLRNMSATHRLLRFGVFELNLDTEELHKFGTKLKLRPQPFGLLALLASRSGQMVTRDEIKKQLWGDETYVDFEHGMNKCIKQIRTALGDDVNKPIYIETVPRHGYRFLAPVTSKTVLAPRVRVKESSSGIPADLAEMIRARLAAKLKGQSVTPSPQPAMADGVSAGVEPGAATGGLTPSADLAQHSTPPLAVSLRTLLFGSLIVGVLIAIAVYWYYHR